MHLDRKKKRNFDEDKGPRFKGFVTSSLAQLERTTGLPDNISDPHDCFGYRILLESFDQSQFLQAVIDLCGTPDLHCPPLRKSPLQCSTSPRRSASPIYISPLTKPALFMPSPSLSPNPINTIASGDYLDDVEFEEYMAQLSRKAEGATLVTGEPGPSNGARAVRCSSLSVVQ